MPRRNRPARRRGYLRVEIEEEVPRPTTTDDMARALVARGLASIAILDRSRHRFTTQRDDNR